MSWPWSTIGLPPDATLTEVESAYQRWRQNARRVDDPQDYERMERAFAAAMDSAGERDPSYLPHGSQYPDPWRDGNAEPGTMPAPTDSIEHKPVPSADVLATSILGLIRQCPDWDALVVAMTPVRGWRDAQAREGADRYLRDWLVDGGQLSANQVVRLARLYDWTPETQPLQDPERDTVWRHIVKTAYAEVAPPDPAYTNAIGRAFIGVAIALGLVLGVLLLPKLLAGGFRVLIPLILAAACAWILIRWRR